MRISASCCAAAWGAQVAKGMECACSVRPTRAEKAMRVAMCVVAAFVSATVAFGVIEPGEAYASVKRGTMSVTLADSLSLNCGEKASVSCEVTPRSERQRPCCSTDYCPSGCDVGAGCLDAEGFCTCLGGSYFTATATCSVTSSAPNVARAQWNNGVLTVRGYNEGTAKVTVTAKMTLWVTSSASIDVTVGPPPGGSGEGEGAGDGIGNGASEVPGTAHDGTAAGNGSDGSAAEAAAPAAGIQDAAGGTSADEGDATSAAAADGTGPASDGAQEAVGDSGDSGKPAGSSTAAKPSTGVSIGSASAGSGSSGNAGVAVQAVSGGTSGDAAAISVGENQDTDPDARVEADSDNLQESGAAAEGGEPRADSVHEMKDAEVAAAAVSEARASGQGSPSAPATGAIVGAVAVIAAAGAAFRYRSATRQRNASGLVPDDQDAQDWAVPGAGAQV